MAIRYCCDWCDKQLPIVVKGEGDMKTATTELSFPREINVTKYFPHLCQSCARKIDMIVGLDRGRRLHAGAVLSTYAELNEERRERLGTKG